MTWDESQECNFREVWQALASKGQADGLGGSQYCRALQAWKQEQYPTPLSEWLPAWVRRDDTPPAPIMTGG